MSFRTVAGIEGLRSAVVPFASQNGLGSFGLGIRHEFGDLIHSIAGYEASQRRPFVVQWTRPDVLDGFLLEPR